MADVFCYLGRKKDHYFAFDLYALRSLSKTSSLLHECLNDDILTIVLVTMVFKRKKETKNEFWTYWRSERIESFQHTRPKFRIERVTLVQL